MVAGGSEQATSPLTVAGFAAMRALSSRNDDPERASRPWDRDRDGFVLGDGAGAMVLEEYEHAVARGATIYCEVAGIGMSGDAHHITSPPDDGAGAVASMVNAIGDAGLTPADIQYVNAHGTSTPQGDVVETLAIKAVFGNDTRVAVSSSKSMIGHLLGRPGRSKVSSRHWPYTIRWRTRPSTSRIRARTAISTTSRTRRGRCESRRR